MGASANGPATEGDASLASLASSIDWVEAADNYVELHIGGQTLMRRMTMREAERALEGVGFIRIHRRFLVNARKIRAIEGTNGDRIVRLGAGIELPVGRAFAINLTRAA
jgi:two-component system LytT family response regulator